MSTLFIRRQPVCSWIKKKEKCVFHHTVTTRLLIRPVTPQLICFFTEVLETGLIPDNRVLLTLTRNRRKCACSSTQLLTWACTYMHLLSMLHEEMVNTVCSSGCAVELVHLHTLSSLSLIIQELLKEEGLNYGRREVWEAEKEKRGMAVWKKIEDLWKSEQGGKRFLRVMLLKFSPVLHENITSCSRSQSLASIYRTLVVVRLWLSAFGVLLYNLRARLCEEQKPKRNKAILLALWSKLTFK